MKIFDKFRFIKKSNTQKPITPDIDYNNIQKVLESWTNLEKFIPTEYPEIEPNSANIAPDLQNLKKKYKFKYEYNEFKTLIQNNPVYNKHNQNIYNALNELLTKKYSLPSYYLSNIFICAGTISKKNVLNILADYYKDSTISNKYIEKERNMGIVNYCSYGFSFTGGGISKFYVSPLIYELANIRGSNGFDSSMSLQDFQTVNYRSLKGHSVINFNVIDEFYSNMRSILSDCLIDKNMNGYVYFELNQNPHAYVQDYSQMRKSYITSDLSMLSDYYAENTPKHILADKYIDIQNYKFFNPDNKKYLVNNPDKLKRLLNISFYPLGKWPGMYSPALMQQAAINQMISNTSIDTPIFSVNGPPGTGKTTLLKEIIADYVVKRAIELAKLEKPKDAFGDFIHFENNQRFSNNSIDGFYKLKNEFIDYGIIVASCNNAAVENITKELPNGSSLKSSYDNLSGERRKITLTNEFDFSQNTKIYFSKLAKEFFSRKNNAFEAWGLISAPLGKQDNLKVVSDYVLSPFLTGNYDEDVSDFTSCKESFLTQYQKVLNMRHNLSEENETYWNSDNINTSNVQSGNPQKNKDFDEERERLFFCALQLQKSFVLSKNDCLSHNLKILNCIFSFNTTVKSLLENNISTDYFTHVFNSLFFLVPVVSTTFASVETMFRHITKPNSLGLLIVDEAGQASPQMAAGAIFRSRKTLIVGDPNQVEPVVTTDEDIQSYAMQELQDIYKSNLESVQTYADRLNPIGAYNKYQQKKIWTGCPLNIHRRCNDPMFSISNGMSYAGSMYDFSIYLDPNDITDSKLLKEFIADKSYWINSSGTIVKDKHYVTEQGDFVKKMVEYSYRKNNGALTLFIISPFKDVTENIREQIRHSNILPNSAEVESWLTNNIGTVHKFQGKECNEVIFLLGCTSDGANDGAIRWVNRNIINVAVTRAKKRLYIVGDKDYWAATNNLFNDNYLWKYASQAKKGYELNYISSEEFEDTYMNSSNEISSQTLNTADSFAISNDKISSNSINGGETLTPEKELQYQQLVRYLFDNITLNQTDIIHKMPRSQKILFNNCILNSKDTIGIALGKCPICSNTVYQLQKGNRTFYECNNKKINICTFYVEENDVFFLTHFNIPLTPQLMRKLLTEGKLMLPSPTLQSNVVLSIQTPTTAEGHKQSWSWGIYLE